MDWVLGEHEREIKVQGGGIRATAVESKRYWSLEHSTSLSAQRGTRSMTCRLG
jgi:hypothetical protein